MAQPWDLKKNVHPALLNLAFMFHSHSCCILIVKGNLLFKLRIYDSSAQFTKSYQTFLLALGVLELVVHEKFHIKSFSEEKTSLKWWFFFPFLLFFFRVYIVHSKYKTEVLNSIFQGDIRNLHFILHLNQMKIHLSVLDVGTSSSKYSFFFAIIVELLENRMQFQFWKLYEEEASCGVFIQFSGNHNYTQTQSEPLYRSILKPELLRRGYE